MNVFGLLYVGEDDEVHVNLGAGGSPLDIYIRCAALSAASCVWAGHKYTLISNQAKLIEHRAERLGVRMPECRGHEFLMEVPTGIPFRSAHYKLELIKAMGGEAFPDESALLDLDAVFVRPSFDVDRAAIAAYDISTQVFPAYGEARVLHDIRTVAGAQIKAPAWYGGEFIASSRQLFGELSPLIDRCWHTYTQHLAELHHVGDEAVLSAALSLAQEAGLPVRDCGLQIARWWSSRTVTKMPALSSVSNRQILHLPADKAFLASYPVDAFDGDIFLARYSRHAKRKAALRKLVTVLRRDGKHSPAI